MEAKQIAPQSVRRLQGSTLFCVLGALLLTLFLEALDNTSVGPAMPRIVGEFHGFDRYSWVVTAYLLTSTVTIPIVGKLSDQFGRKWFLLVGTGIFLIGSLLSGSSQSMNQLIVFRALQGFGSGMGMALVATVIGDIFPPEKRAQGQASVNIVYALANLIGPTTGGWLTDHGPLLGTLVTEATRWRWIFYLNLPLGIIAVTALMIYLPANISERSSYATGWQVVRQIDVAGALLCTATTVCLLLGLSWGSDQHTGWYALQVVSILIGAGTLCILFLLIEQRATEPILPLNIFRSQIVAADAALSLLVYMILLGLAIYLPLFLQGVLGVSATNAGVMMTPFLIAVTVGATLAGWLIAIYRRYQIIIITGTLVMTSGVFLLTRMTSATGLLQAVIFMVIAGLGIGSIFSVLYLAVQNALPATQLGVGSAAVRYLGQIGSMLGVALVGAVVQAVRGPLATAIQHGFAAVLVFCIAAILAALFLKDSFPRA
jgi:MFS family permease